MVSFILTYLIGEGIVISDISGRVIYTAEHPSGRFEINLADSKKQVYILNF